MKIRLALILALVAVAATAAVAVGVQPPASASLVDVDAELALIDQGGLELSGGGCAPVCAGPAGICDDPGQQRCGYSSGICICQWCGGGIECLPQ